MSEGRRASNAQRRRNTSSSGEDRSPFVLRSGPRRAFDYDPVAHDVVARPLRGRRVRGPDPGVHRHCSRFRPRPNSGEPAAVRRRALHRGLDDLRHGAVARSTSRRTSRRSARSIIFVGVNIGGMGVLTLASILGLVISKRLGLRAKLIAASDTNPLRSHGGPVNEGQTVRLGEVGVLLRTVALSTLVIEGVIALLLYPSLILARHRPARRAVGGAVLRRDGVHQHRLHPEPRRARRRSPTTTSCSRC